jgi:hypothetical protein
MAKLIARRRFVWCDRKSVFRQCRNYPIDNHVGLVANLLVGRVLNRMRHEDARRLRQSDCLERAMPGRGHRAPWSLPDQSGIS